MRCPTPRISAARPSRYPRHCPNIFYSYTGRKRSITVHFNLTCIGPKNKVRRQRGHVLFYFDLEPQKISTFLFTLNFHLHESVLRTASRHTQLTFRTVSNSHISGSSESIGTEHPLVTEPQQYSTSDTPAVQELRSRKATGDVQVARTTSRPSPQNTRQSFSTSLRRAATTMLQPEKKIGQAPSMWQSTKSIILSSCTVPPRCSLLLASSYILVVVRGECPPRVHSYFCALLALFVASP